MISENMIRFQESMKKWKQTIKEQDDIGEEIFKDDIDYYYKRLTEEEKKSLIIQSCTNERKSL